MSEEGPVMRFRSVEAARSEVAGRKTSMAAGARPPAPSETVKAGAEALIRARMVGAGVQARTVAATGSVPKAVEHVAIVVDVMGELKVERSEVTALFDRSACAVARLHADGLIGWPGFRAALAFAWAGDVVLGGFRVRTVDFDRTSAAALSIDGLGEAERTALARQRWLIAKVGLMAAQFRILDGVMRHDESAVAAARAAYPRLRSRDKLSGMGDQALIDASATLAVEYGFEPRPPREGLRLR